VNSYQRINQTQRSHRQEDETKQQLQLARDERWDQLDADIRLIGFQPLSRSKGTKEVPPLK
jgi:hypothetical protein